MRRSHPHMSPLIAAALVLSALAFTAVIPISHAQQSGSDALITELAERYVGQQYGGYSYGNRGGSQGPSLQLLPGRTPDGASLNMVVPQGGRLIGSVVRSYDNSGPYNYTYPPYQSGTQTTTIDVFLDVPGDLDWVADSVEAALAARGWVSPPINFGSNYDSARSGFQQPPITVSRSLCLNDGSNGLTMTVTSPLSGSSPTSMNSVRLTTGSVGSCSLLALRPAPSSSPSTFPIPAPPSVSPSSFPLPNPYAAPRNPIPALAPPDGAQVRTTPYPSSPMSSGYTTAATVTTPMRAAALDAFFGSQLQQAGWERTTGGADGPVAWSAWQVPGDQELLGVLTAVETPVEDERVVVINVYSATPQGGPYGSSYPNYYQNFFPTPSSPGPSSEQ